VLVDDMLAFALCFRKTYNGLTETKVGQTDFPSWGIICALPKDLWEIALPVPRLRLLRHQ
jgi:hypothetical protein